jgi:serine/threonine-protein kinase
VSCTADLAHLADSDGIAGELPDAQYLCESCEQSESDRPPGAGSLRGYRIIGELGRGGMGVVFKAVQESTRRIVAVKQMLPRVNMEEREFRLFEREIVVHSSVRHHNLARLLDHGRGDGGSYLVVEYLAGGDANQLVRSAFKGPVPIALAIRIGLEILDGVESLHRGGIIHRDLKPQNILLSKPPEDGFGTAKITDYGLAKPFEDAGNSLFDLTRDDEAAGSLMFMPPEQILNYRNVQPPADVYAVGVSLYFLLTAKYTVDPTTPSHQGIGTLIAGQTRNPIEALIEDEPVPMLDRRSDLPEPIARVIDTAVKKELSDRYDSAARFREELAAAAREAGVS